MLHVIQNWQGLQSSCIWLKYTVELIMILNLQCMTWKWSAKDQPPLVRFSNIYVPDICHFYMSTQFLGLQKVCQEGQNFLLTLFYYFNRVFLIVCRWSNLLVIDKFLSNIMMMEKFLSNCNSELRIGYLDIWKVKVSSFSLIEKFLSNANFGVLVLILKSESGNFEFD